MESKCMICGKFFDGKGIVQLACVPVEWDEGLENQWLFACWQHDGVEEHADTEETERFHESYMPDYNPYQYMTGWRRYE